MKLKSGALRRRWGGEDTGPSDRPGSCPGHRGQGPLTLALPLSGRIQTSSPRECGEGALSAGAPGDTNLGQGWYREVHEAQPVARVHLQSHEDSGHRADVFVGALVGGTACPSASGTLGCSPEKLCGHDWSHLCGLLSR